MDWYYLNRNEEATGPVTAGTLEQLRAAGGLADDARVCREGTEEWIPFEQAFASAASCGRESVEPGALATDKASPSSKRRIDRWQVALASITLALIAVAGFIYSTHEPALQSAGELLELADAYALGKGVDQDWQLAVDYLQQAADKGNSEAKCKLASCYRYGHGVEQSDRLASKWTREAAEDGEPVVSGNSITTGTAEDLPVGDALRSAFRTVFLRSENRRNA